MSKARRPDQHTAIENAQRLYDQLIGLGPPDEVSAAIALKRIGMLADIAGDLGREEGTTLALNWANALSTSKLRSPQRSLLEYSAANAWHNRRRLRHQHTAVAWQWEQPELLQEIYHLRAAAQSKGFDKLAANRSGLCRGSPYGLSSLAAAAPERGQKRIEARDVPRGHCVVRARLARNGSERIRKGRRTTRVMAV